MNCSDALRRKLFDQPGERRSHAVATPRGGGIAIVVTLLLAAAVAAALGIAWLRGRAAGTAAKPRTTKGSASFERPAAAPATASAASSSASSSPTSACRSSN